MAKFKFKPTATITFYAPELISTEWWEGFIDGTTNSVRLVPGQKGMSPFTQDVVLSQDDVLEMKE